MNYKAELHDKAHRVKSILGSLEWLIHSPVKDGLWVLNYHGTPEVMMEEFKEQFFWLKKYYRIISPDTFSEMMSGNTAIKGRNLLFTFDDGLKNNLHVAKFLNSQQVSAYFFVVPAFIDCPESEQAAYYSAHIRPNPSPATHPAIEDQMSMSKSDLLFLQSMGHRVEAHTYTHTLVAATSTAENSTREIVAVKQYLLDAGFSPVDSFCSINNSLESVGAREKKLIADHYAYHFTTLPGNNIDNPDPLFIKRINVEVHWLKGAMQYALGTWDLKRWESRINQYRIL